MLPAVLLKDWCGTLVWQVSFDTYDNEPQFSPKVVLFVVYVILVTICLLNMLIAMMVRHNLRSAHVDRKIM